MVRVMPECLGLPPFCSHSPLSQLGWQGDRQPESRASHRPAAQGRRMHPLWGKFMLFIIGGTTRGG